MNLRYSPRLFLTGPLTLALGLIMCFASNQSAQAQDFRADGTFYLRAGIGANTYHGERSPDEDLGQILDEQIGFPSLQAEFGYSGRLGPLGASIGLQYIGGQYEWVIANEGDHINLDHPDIHEIDHDRSTDWRHAISLLGRLNFAPDARVSPYLQAGLGGKFGEIVAPTTPDDVNPFELAFAPSLGLGLDIALTDRLGLFLELQGFATFPDFNMDRAIGEDENFDVFTFAGGGLRFNFASPFTPVQVIAIDGPTTLEVNESGTFTATVNDEEATPPLEYEWDFGDGTTDTGLLATHSYDQAGTYTVTFTARDARQEDSQSMTVTVEEPPVPPEIVTINATPNPADVGEEVSFTSNIRGDQPIQCEWDFGDGNTSTDCNPTHTYQQDGTYNVTLTATSDIGQDTASLTMIVEPTIPAFCAEITELNSVFFGRNSSTLSAEAQVALSENAEILEQCPNIDVRIEGFAARGERNPQGLSEDRARAVEEYYIDAGIEAGRLTTLGMGADPDVATKKADEQARRVDSIPLHDGVAPDVDNDVDF